MKNFDLVLCHLNVAPRNILWLEDGSICFVDWEAAGFFPRLFEVCRQRILYGLDGDFNRLLLENRRGSVGRPHVSSLVSHAEILFVSCVKLQLV